MLEAWFQELFHATNPGLYRAYIRRVAFFHPTAKEINP